MIEYASIRAMVAGGTVEGVGSRHTVRYLRLTDPQVTDAESVSPVAMRPGSIMSDASQTVYREPVAKKYKLWQHKAVRLGTRRGEAKAA